jgi:uncharacterized protein YjbI with pentapeptide repeats
LSTPSQWRAHLLAGEFDAQALRLPAGSVVDLKGADLKGLDLKNLGLFPWDLTGADLRGATFDPGFIARCRLQGARFEAPPPEVAEVLALWSGALPEALSLTQALLDGLDLSDKALGELNLTRCSLRGARFTGASFETLDLGQSDLAGAHLDQMQGGDLLLAHAKLGGARLDGSSFSSLRLDMTQADESSWVGVRVEQVLARSATLQNADFSKSQWEMGAFDGCEVSGLNTEKASFGEVLGL